MRRAPTSNFQDLHVDHFNCFFSQIREVSHATLHHRPLPSPDLNNCFVSQQNDEILIISRGGTRFHLPMDQQVSRVFPLPEGILIEFFIKPEVKLQEVLYFQKNKNSMDMEEGERNGRFCYATLTRHPYNPLKLLGELGNEEVAGWVRLRERVVWASWQLPLLVSYNEELCRNAFHLLLANTADVARQYQFAFIPTHTYSLKNLPDNPHYEVLTQTIYEQASQNEPVTTVVLNRTAKRGTVLLYAATALGEVRVYEVDFYGSHNATRLLTKIGGTRALLPASLYTPNAFYLQDYRNHDAQLLTEILRQQLALLPDCVAVLHDTFIGYYRNGFLVATEPLAKYSTPLSLHNGKLQDGNGQIITLPPLVGSAFDALVLRTLEIILEDEKAVVKCLSLYCSGSTLVEALSKAGEGRGNILLALHLLYQELKLYELMKEEREKLAQLLLQLAAQSGRRDYYDYYLREGYSTPNTNSSSFNLAENLGAQEIYDIFSAVNRLLANPSQVRGLFAVYNRSKFVLNFFQLLVWGQAKVPVQAVGRQQAGSAKFGHGREYFFRQQYPLLSQQVFHLEYLSQVFEAGSGGHPKAHSKEQRAFLYLIRNHHSQNQILSYPLGIRAVFAWLLRQMRRQLPYSLYEMIPELGFRLIQREDLFKNIELYRLRTVAVPYHLQRPSLDDHIKTLVHTSTSQEYFLTSNASQMNKLNNDLVFEEVDRLLSSSSEIRIKVKDIEAIPEDRWEIESQNILLKFASRRLAIIIGQGAFNLGISRSFITDIIKVAKINLSALMPNDIKITLDLKDDKEAIVHWPEFHAGMAAGLRLSRHVIPLSEDHLKTWIFYQKPDAPRRDHSGFLLSLGLLGYLRCFSPTDIYQYLKPNNQFTSVAILLGVSASNIARSDEALSKALILHIPVLLPPSIDVEIPVNVQTSALIGIGLLHRGTCNRTMTEMTLSQIGKRPSSDKCLQRQGYSLAAGWALGMICLGMRDKKESFRDLQLQQRLVRFIEGGKVIEPPQSMISTNYINESKCSSIKEGPYVNLHITAPAALLALALMYLKSNDQELAARVTIPNSFNTIEECNPNHILLKTLTKNLILWDSITPTREFVLSQVPELIRFIYENPLNRVYERYYLVYNVSEIDYQTITTIYLSVITGALLAMALRFAGTGNQNVVKIIRDHIEHLRTVKITKCEFANDPLNKNSIDQYELFSLISASLLGLAVVMAGTCDVESLKLIRVIRKKFQDSKIFHYGFSMAINMAIGFVFLGYGNYTFNREDMSIAALLISIFPQFPNAPADNRWHLQALRHFYVLAMEQKIFHAVDVDTNKVVNVNARMTFQVDGQSIVQDLHTPVLLQQSKKLTHIRIIDEDYFDVDFSFAGSSSDPKAIYIKRKHFKDVNAKLLDPQHVLTTPLIQQHIQHHLAQEPRFTALFQSKPTASALAYLLPNKQNDQFKSLEQKLEKGSDDSELYFRLLKEDRLEMLQIYMTLRREMGHIDKGGRDSLTASNVSLLLSFEKWIGCHDFASLIHQPLASITKILASPSSEQQELIKYLVEPHSARLSKPGLYRWLRLLQLPSSRELLVLRNGMRVMAGRGEKRQNIEMLLLLNYPQCSQQLLQLLLAAYLGSSY